MDKDTVNRLTNIGVAGNVAAGHAGEMAGAAIKSVGNATGCPVAKTVGRAVESAGRAWSDTAVRVGNRDRDRLTK
jgi:hypothetical protein